MDPCTLPSSPGDPGAPSFRVPCESVGVTDRNAKVQSQKKIGPKFPPGKKHKDRTPSLVLFSKKRKAGQRPPQRLKPRSVWRLMRHGCKPCPSRSCSPQTPVCGRACG